MKGTPAFWAAIVTANVFVAAEKYVAALIWGALAIGFLIAEWSV